MGFGIGDWGLGIWDLGLCFYLLILINVRRTTTDTYLPKGGGISGTKPILVKKGDTFLYSVHAMHRREDLWDEDADQFKPERWEERQLGSKFLSFSIGPRICVSRRFCSCSFVLSTCCGRIGANQGACEYGNFRDDGNGVYNN